MTNTLSLDGLYKILVLGICGRVKYLCCQSFQIIFIFNGVEKLSMDSKNENQWPLDRVSLHKE